MTRRRRAIPAGALCIKEAGEAVDAVLRLSNITKRFPGVTALDDVSLELARAEVHALVGENGAGKSTLMKILSGVYRQDEGSVELNGAPVAFRTPHEAQTAGISIIFQEFSLIRSFDVTDNVFLNREPTRLLGHLDKRAARQKTRDLLAEIGIELDVDRRVDTLSVVEQQIVEIAKALSVTASVLIMDEPSAALTDKELRKLFDIIRTLKSRGVTVIYISHMLDEVFEIADHVSVLKDGRLVGTRRAEDLSKGELIRMMVGRTIEDYFPPLSSQRGPVLLEARNLGTGGRLSGITFQLHAGEILGIAGMVGSGRNLLARTLLGLEPVDTGELLVQGKKQRFRGIADAMAAGLGYISDDRKAEGILGPMKLAENITIASLPAYLAAGFLRLRREASDARAEVERLSIRASGIGQLVETLSGGNQQKVLLSRWLLRKPDIFVISEPTRGIDVGAKAEIYRILRQATSAGKAVIMISSELPEVIGMSDRVLVMRAGTIQGMVDQHERPATEEQLMSLAVGHEYSMEGGKESAR